MPSDPYLTLQVDRRATDAQIRRAYFRLVRKYHPDRNRDDPNAIERFKQIQEAYEQLSKQPTLPRRESVIRAGYRGPASSAATRVHADPPARGKAGSRPTDDSPWADWRRHTVAASVLLLAAVALFYGANAASFLKTGASQWLGQASDPDRRRGQASPSSGVDIGGSTRAAYRGVSVGSVSPLPEGRSAPASSIAAPPSSSSQSARGDVAEPTFFSSVGERDAEEGPLGSEATMHPDLGRATSSKQVGSEASRADPVRPAAAGLFSRDRLSEDQILQEIDRIERQQKPIQERDGWLRSAAQPAEVETRDDRRDSNERASLRGEEKSERPSRQAGRPLPSLETIGLTPSTSTQLAPRNRSSSSWSEPFDATASLATPPTPLPQVSFTSRWRGEQGDPSPTPATPSTNSSPSTSTHRLPRTAPRQTSWNPFPSTDTSSNPPASLPQVSFTSRWRPAESDPTPAPAVPKGPVIPNPLTTLPR